MSKREVRRSAFLDLEPKQEKAASRQLAYTDAPLTGVVVAIIDAAQGLVEVRIDGTEETVVATADAGLTYIGARVSLPRDSSGRVTGVRAPSGPTPDGAEVVGVGESGRRIQALDAGLAQARAEVSANHEAVTQKMAEYEETIKDAAGVLGVVELNLTRAQEKAEQAARDAQAAKAQAEQAAAQVSTVDGRYTVADADPQTSDGVGKPVGGVWEVRSGSTSLRRFVWDGTAWVQVKAGADFIADKAIGSAQIGDAAIGTAQVAELSVEKLTATAGASFTSAVMQALLADEAFVNRLWAERIVVAGGNLFPDPRIEGGSGAWAMLGAGTTIGQVSGILGNTLTISGSGKNAGAYYWPKNVAQDTAMVLEPGATYRLRCRFTYTAPQGGGVLASVHMRYRTSAGSVVTKSLMPIVDADGAYATSVATLDKSFVMPQDADPGTCTLGFFAQAPMTGGSLSVGEIQVMRAVGATLIEPGSVAAPHLKATVDMWAKLLTVAGDATIGGRLLVKGAVGAREVNAQEISAAIGRFLSITTDQLTAGTVKIASEMIADQIVGKKITGSEVIAASSGGASIGLFPSDAYSSEPVIDINVHGKPLPSTAGQVPRGTHILLNPYGLEYIPRWTGSGPIPERGFVSWANMIQPPWAEVKWNGSDMNNVGNLPMGDQKLSCAYASVRFCSETWDPTGNPVKTDVIHIPVNGFYFIQSFTEWYWSTTQANWAVASGLWHAFPGPGASGGIDWTQYPAMTTPLIGGVTTQAIASGAAYMTKGDKITVGWWQNTGVWKPQKARLYVRFLGN